MCSKLWFLSIVLNLANMQVHKLQAGDNWPTSPVNYQATTDIADIQKDKTSCTTSIDKSKRLHSAQCKPRPHVVSIMETFGKNTPTGVLNPTHIETMRCSGTCSHNSQECMPKEVHYLQMPVTVISLKDTGNNFGTVKECVTTVVEYHESCSCKCATEDKCDKQMQRYNEESCKCECIDSSYMQQYCRRRRNIWDESTCRCKCRRRPTCSTGSVFHPDKCICIKVEDDVHWKSKHP